jgi:hypothetical protein
MVTKKKPNPFFNQGVVSLVIILVVVILFSFFSVRALDRANDSRLTSFISVVPSLAEITELRQDNLSRLCEELAREAFVIGVDVTEYQCVNNRDSYVVSVLLSDRRHICISSGYTTPTPRACDIPTSSSQ